MILYFPGLSQTAFLSKILSRERALLLRFIEFPKIFNNKHLNYNYYSFFKVSKSLKINLKLLFIGFPKIPGSFLTSDAGSATFCFHVYICKRINSFSYQFNPFILLLLLLLLLLILLMNFFNQGWGCMMRAAQMLLGQAMVFNLNFWIYS
jgi:hypothetical protein